MRDVIGTIEFKIKCANYHFNQAIELESQLNKENIHIFISEFCGMMEMLQSSIDIASSCAYKQSAVEMRTFNNLLKESQISELEYIEQFLKANRTGNVFNVIDHKEVQIISIAKRKQQGFYDQRNVAVYMQQVKKMAENMVNEFMKIYTKSVSHYDSSWRTIDSYCSAFVCKECGWPVTKLLGHLGNLSELSLKEKEPLITNRNYVYGHELIRANLLPWGGDTEISENEVIIPIGSLYFDVKKESAPGCCGPDSSEFNIYCKNGHAVGKEAADCWMPHFIRLPFDKVNRNELI
ncbi:hypothetical protein [Bacillus sp. Marseille-P3661]|uniref:hypothetical protein n=1 Tax=Bacillus sp. Marseille-P3661 TaxID=1936234 RepID=UPI000C834BFE|nr:hypothetical protein [Bacillus sp. Marseille-P3661]